MRAFVTGGTGLLGGNLVRELLARGHQVRALARSTEKAERLLGDTLVHRKLPALTRGGTSTVDARDVAAGMIEAAEKGEHGERYLLAGRYASLREVAEAVTEVSGVAAPRLTLPDPLVLLYAHLCELWARLTGRPTVVTVAGVKTMNERKSVSSQKAISKLGVTFRPLLETVADEFEWFRARGVAG